MWLLVAAAALNVTPVLIQLSPGSPSALLALRNEGGEPARVQLTIHLWQEGPQGQVILNATSEVEVFPPLLTLGPGEKRNIRLGGDLRSAAIERSFRLIVEELPSPRAHPERAVEFATLTRLSLPVFFEPAERVVKAAATRMSIGGGRLSFALENAGTVHVRPRAVHVRAADAAGATIAEQQWDGWYLLAGGVRGYELPIAPADCARIASVSFEAPDDEAPIASSWRPPAGGCGR